MKIEYWSDYACPYCYIGEAHLEEALHALEIDDVEVSMRAFELDPRASKSYQGPTVQRFARKYGLDMEQAAQRIEGISQAGREAGLDFEYAQTRYTSTFDAHRLTKLAFDRLGADGANKVAKSLFDAYFGKGQELSDKDVLAEIAAAVGLDANEVNELLAGDAYASAVRDDEEVAAKMGVRAVPFFVIDGEYAVPGALPAAEFEKVLGKAAAAAEGANSLVAACGPDGCGF